ncbi:lymphocyte activation gene 3 protein-like [Antennarius striatus]|uniref:lymphocyte activation gene 3 protein-like n=1 Tax=Antennarius striatus TaxID=241820 RepID=UPI0035ADFD56
MLLMFVILGGISYLLTAQCEVLEVLAAEGSQAVLPCKCSLFSTCSPVIIWHKANKGTVWKKEKNGLQYWGYSWLPTKNQRIQCPHSQFERGDYSLQINNVMEEDGGKYFCTLAKGDQVYENVVMLRIIKVTVSPSAAISEKNVSISCNMTPWAYGASVQWMLNNNFVSQTGIITNRGMAGSVLREKATAGLSGNWSCIVGYRGKEGRASATLALIGIIQPPKDNTNVYAAAGSAVTLPCVFSDLIPSLQRWEKLKPAFSGHLPVSFSQSSQLRLDNSATLGEVAFEDEGTYRCSGTMEGRQLTRSMQLVVAKIDSSTLSHKQGSVTLTCLLTDTTEITRYEWVHVVYDISGSQSVVSIQSGKTLQISKISAAAQGEWICRFYGKEGMLGNISYHFPLMSGLFEHEASGLSYNNGAVIGFSCLLLVLLLVLFKTYKNHQRRKRIFPYPALETVIHTISNEQEQRQKNGQKMERHFKEKNLTALN